MHKIIPIALAIAIIAGIAGVGIYNHLSEKTHWNDTYVNGNTAGNLYNGGHFCESGGVVFFSNPSDCNRLYSMNPDGSDLKKISDYTVTYINADDNYIYFVRSNAAADEPFAFLNINTDSLCRIDRDGNGKIVVLDSKPCMYAALFGNYIYYLHYDTTSATCLYKVKIDGSDQKQVSSESINPSSADGQYFYYNGLEGDHYIWRMDTATGATGMSYGGNCWMPSVKDNLAYFMDCNKDYSLACVDLDTGDVTQIVNDRIDCYNVAGDYIYFQRNSEESPALCRVRTDGSDYEVLAEGVYQDINVTSRYVYFCDYQTSTMYCMPVTGGAITEFAP